MSVQTNKQLKALIEAGEIVMHPKRLDQVNNGSVDVSLGRFIARVPRQTRIDLNRDESIDVFKIEDLAWSGFQLLLDEGERVLAHTHEFIGGRRFTIPEMRAKSSTARWGLTVCACAGWGDVGYFNRWTMEIKNLNPGPVKIDVGTLIAQIVFHVVETPEEGTIYNEAGAGTYQQGADLNELMKAWRPEMMLPKKMKSNGFEAVCPADVNLFQKP